MELKGIDGVSTFGVSDVPPLGIYIVWHPANDVANELARSMFRAFCADPELPATRGLGIPIHFRTSISNAVAPEPVPLDKEELTTVFVFVDDEFVSSRVWCDYAIELTKSVRSGVHLVPISMTSPSRFPAQLQPLQAIRLDNIAPDQWEVTLLNEVAHDVCQTLDPDALKVRVFLSHSKRDGLDITTAVRRHFHEVARLDDFFDTTDIPYGTRFGDVIGLAAGTLPALLAIQTDSYSSREWCRLEVLDAKQHRVPIVILSAVELREHRAFPYMGNVPVVRWRGESSLSNVVGALLFEVLRNRYFPKRVANIYRHLSMEPGDESFSYPPELLTVLVCRMEAETSGRTVGRLIYPDPPLGSEEINLIHQFDPTIDPVTPTILSSRTS